MVDNPPRLVGRVLEQQKRMSESLLWKLQSAAYCQFGIDAWREKGVPFYLTGNPMTARKYAHVVLGYIRDCLNGANGVSIDLAHPINIIDLGAGTGRFAYLFLKHFIPMLKALNIPSLTIRYVMTDIVHENIEFWQKHPYFEHYIKDGILDFAYYQHAERETPLHLIHSKQVLSHESNPNPLVLIANYFFDTIPQDLFRINHGQLEEGRVTLSVAGISDTEPLDPLDPELIGKLRCDYDYYPIENPEKYYFEMPKVNDTLMSYLKMFNNIPFLFPIGAFQSLEYFYKLSGGKFLLVAGDQGIATETQVKEFGEPRLDRHGTFSIPVSYHALVLHFRQRGGFGLLPEFAEPIFVELAAGAGGNITHFPETEFAFEQHISAFEPKDYWKMVNCMEKERIVPSLECLMIILKMGSWDPANFHAFFPMVRAHIPKATQKVREDLKSTIHKIWEQFFPISVEEGDFILNLGVLLFDIGDFPGALLFFQRSLEITGDQERTYANMGACYLSLHDAQSAHDCFKKAKQLSRGD